jgi:hypothetical protein
MAVQPPGEKINHFTYLEIKYRNQEEKKYQPIKNKLEPDNKLRIGQQ